MNIIIELQTTNLIRIMKKFIMLAMVFSVLVGCAPHTIEDDIKSTFKTYVEENFGNPDDFIEIVKIELMDTISTENTKAEIEEIVAMNDSLLRKTDSLGNYYLEKMTSLSNNTSKLMRFRSDDKAIKLLVDAYESVNESISFATSVEYNKYKIARENIDAVLAVEDSIFMLQHKIRVRMLEKGEPVVNDFYSLADKNGIKIYDREIIVSDYPESIENSYEALGELSRAFSVKQEYSFNHISAIKEFVDYIEVMSK